MPFVPMRKRTGWWTLIQGGTESQFAQAVGGE